jgi:hypothetical protein
MVKRGQAPSAPPPPLKRAKRQRASVARDSEDAVDGSCVLVRGVITCPICLVNADATGHNWHEIDSSTGRDKPAGAFCDQCGEFVDASPFKEEWLVENLTSKAGTKAKDLRASLQAKLAEFQEHRQNPDEIQFAQCSVFEETSYSGTLVEKCNFIDRATFHASREMYPDDCKMTQVKFSNRKREDAPHPYYIGSQVIV